MSDPVETILLAARWVSVGLFLASTVACWFLSKE